MFDNIHSEHKGFFIYKLNDSFLVDEVWTEYPTLGTAIEAIDELKAEMNRYATPGILTQEELYDFWADSTLESADFWGY